MKKYLLILLIISNLALYPLLFLSFVVNQKQAKQLTQYLAYVEQQLRQAPTPQATTPILDGKGNDVSPLIERKNSWELRVMNKLLQDEYVKERVHRGATMTSFSRFNQNGFITDFSLPNNFLDQFPQWNIVPDDSDLTAPAYFSFSKPLGDQLYTNLFKRTERYVDLSFTFFTTGNGELPWVDTVCDTTSTSTMKIVAALFLKQGIGNPQDNPCAHIQFIKTLPGDPEQYSLQIYRFDEATAIGELNVDDVSFATHLLVLHKPEDLRTFPNQAALITLRAGFGYGMEHTLTERKQLQQEMAAVITPFVDNLAVGFCEYACAY